MTYALELAAVVIGLFGLSSSFGALVLARRRSPGDGSEPSEPSLRRVQIPFGPFLVLAALVYLFAGPQIWAALLPPG